VEEALLFFEDDIYIKGWSLLPKDRLNQKITWRGQGTYIGIIWIVAIASWVSIAFQALK
jgi:hypothetical protein